MTNYTELGGKTPSPEAWLREAKAEANAAGAGMYLIHNGVVRKTSKAFAREGDGSAKEVCGMELSCDAEKLEKAAAECRAMPGICCVRVWVNSGRLQVGDDIMYALVGGDIRPRVIKALETLVDAIKTECLTETEIH